MRYYLLTHGKQISGKTAVLSDFFSSGSQTIYAFLEYWQKPRCSAVSMRRINGLTSAVLITDENCGLDRAYQPQLDFFQTPDDLPFDGRDGNVKILQRTRMHHLLHIRLDFIYGKTECVRTFL